VRAIGLQFAAGCDFNSKVKPLLTEEQRAEWQKIRDEMRAQLRERWRNR
jgi:hypothetical protein